MEVETMKSTLKIAISLISLVSITACGTTKSSINSSSYLYEGIDFTETVILADDYTYHQWTNVPPYTFLSNPRQYDLIAEFKSEKQIYMVSDETPDADGYYHCYLSLPLTTDNLEEKFPDKGIINAYDKKDYDLILVNTIGRYISYAEYSYSEKAHAVKLEEVHYREMDEIKDANKMIGQKFLCVFLTNKGELIIVNQTPPSNNIRKIEPFERTTYYQVDKDVEVTFDHP